MKITDLDPKNQDLIRQAASLLVKGFKTHWPNAWRTMEEAWEEVQESLQPDRISRVALNEEGIVLGWIGAIKEYHGHAWELHPLVVDPDSQGIGIGRALVNDLEEQVRRHGGEVIFLGTDDEDGMTSVSNVELFPDVLGHLAEIRNLKRHPYEFYQKLGYFIVGVIPDANGPGKPDILMAKRITN